MPLWLAEWVKSLEAAQSFHGKGVWQDLMEAGLVIYTMFMAGLLGLGVWVIVGTRH